MADPGCVAESAVVACAEQIDVPYCVLAAACAALVKVHDAVAVASAVPGCVAHALDSGQAIVVPVAELEAEAGLVEGMEALGRAAFVGHRQRALSASERHSYPPCHFVEAWSLPVSAHRHHYRRRRRRRQRQQQPLQPRLPCEVYHEVAQFRVSSQRTVSLVSAVAGVDRSTPPRQSDQPFEDDHVYAWEAAVFRPGR